MTQEQHDVLMIQVPTLENIPKFKMHSGRLTLASESVDDAVIRSNNQEFHFTLSLVESITCRVPSELHILTARNKYSQEIFSSCECPGWELNNIVSLQGFVQTL